jgi:SAM-dependent methyltransferase
MQYHEKELTVNMQYSEIALQQVRERRLLINRLDQWLFDEIAPYVGQRILEVGCGLGNLARFLVDRELYIGTDISAESVQHISRMYHDNPHMSACVADAADPKFLELTPYQFDTVVSINAFEHIQHDLAAMRNVYDVLSPGHHFVLIVPAHDQIYGTMDGPIGHYRRYNKEMMAAKFKQVGFTLVTQKYINALGALGWFINGRLFRRGVPPSGQLRLFNILAPWLQRMENLVDMPFGLSILAVGRKDIAD